MPERIIYKSEFLNNKEISNYESKILIWSLSQRFEENNSNYKEKNIHFEYWDRFYRKSRVPEITVPEFEISAFSHKDGSESNIPEIIRIQKLPVKDYVSQVGQTCGLTSFAMIMGALGKKIPTYEELTGKSASEITGSFPDREHRIFLNRRFDFSDIKETVVKAPANLESKKLIQAVFGLLSEGNYLYVSVNWTKLHGVRHSKDQGYLDHGIIVHGVRETASYVQGDKVNFLITDPNSQRYHNIWIPAYLLQRAMLDNIRMIGYKIVKPDLKEKVSKVFTRKRPINRVTITA